MKRNGSGASFLMQISIVYSIINKSRFFFTFLYSLTRIQFFQNILCRYIIYWYPIYTGYIYILHIILFSSIFNVVEIDIIINIIVFTN